MKVKEEIKTIEQKIISYIAEDGAEFKTEKECNDYEQKQILKELIEAAERLRITELDEQIPLSNNGLIDINDTFRWYKLKNKEDFETVNKAYVNNLGEPEKYPEVICVETYGYEVYTDDAYSYDMKTCKEITENFWKKLGYKVTIEKDGD